MNKTKNNIDPQNKLIVFQSKNIRRTWHKDEWHYSLVDVVAVLSRRANPADYLKQTRCRFLNKDLYKNNIHYVIFHIYSKIKL